MKLNRWFVVGILVFLVVMFIVELQLPKNFSWKPTFRHADKQRLAVTSSTACWQRPCRKAIPLRTALCISWQRTA